MRDGRVHRILATTHHSHGIQLPKRTHRLQQDHDQTSSLNRLDRPCKQVWRDRLEVLQHAHSVRLTQDLVRLLVICVADVRDRDEYLERVLLVRLPDAALDVSLDLGLPLFSVAGVKVSICTVTQRGLVRT